MTPRLDAALADLFELPSGGSSACPEPADWKTVKRGRPYRSRLARSSERKPWNVLKALPAGTVRAASQKAWLDAVDESPELAGLRSDALANVRKVARALAWRADWTSMTTRPGDDVLVAQTGVSERTVHRVVRRLKDARLLGVVAPNRSPAVQTVKALAGQGEVAVYVLAAPSPLSVVEPADEPVDESGPASTLESSVSDPLRAREAGDCSSEPLRGPHPLAPGGAGGPGPAPGEPVLRPSARLTRTERLDRRMAQARQVARRVPVLAGLPPRAVAAVLRDFALAGWTTLDVVSCVDFQPDGTRWPHDGATGVKQPAKWLTFRLAMWRDETGAPRPAPSAVREAAARARADRQRAERAAAAAPPREVAWVDFSAGYAAFRAARAALPRRGTPR